MSEINSLIHELEASGRNVFWQGKVSSSSIERLEELLHARLPSSYGGGGVVGEEISGIEDDDPFLEYRGNVYGDTIQIRTDHELPVHLIVIVHRVADRPDRFEPRMAKRRPKNYDRLMKPRQEVKREMLKHFSKI